MNATDILRLADNLKEVPDSDGITLRGANALRQLLAAGQRLVRENQLLRLAAHQAEGNWDEAFAAFKGAFDTPVARRQDQSEFAQDARRRLRSYNEDVLEARRQRGAMELLAMPEAWKAGNEFARYHPQASHVSPDYRDGWNACFGESLKEFVKLRTVPAGFSFEADGAGGYILRTPCGGGVYAHPTDSKLSMAANGLGMLAEALLKEPDPIDGAVPRETFDFREASNVPGGVHLPDEAAFLIHYDDQEKRPEIWTGEVAARARFKTIGGQWNAHLFVKLASNSRDDRAHGANAQIVPLGDCLPKGQTTGADWVAEFHRQHGHFPTYVQCFDAGVLRLEAQGLKVRLQPLGLKDAAVDGLARVLHAAWSKAEPSHRVTLHPESYWATFADMARAAFDASQMPVDEQACVEADKK